MTIITKPLCVEKKADVMEVPLVKDDQLASAPASEDVESGGTSILIVRAKLKRVPTTSTLGLLVMVLSAIALGVWGFKYMHDQYQARTQYRCQIKIPMMMTREDQDAVDGAVQMLHNLDYLDDQRKVLDDSSARPTFDELKRAFFEEDMELDVDNGQYEKIDVPDFNDGRNGRFIHDFNSNTTGIIDLTGNRCFVLPLDRTVVLPPRSLYDLVMKISDGYYKVDTQVVRENMRVVMPPLDNLDSLGSHIASECQDRPVYKLEKIVGGVVKRSAELHEEAKFAQFSGGKITEFDIVNLEEAKRYESLNR